MLKVKINDCFNFEIMIFFLIEIYIEYVIFCFNEWYILKFLNINDNLEIV